MRLGCLGAKKRLFGSDNAGYYATLFGIIFGPFKNAAQHRGALVCRRAAHLTGRLSQGSGANAGNGGMCVEYGALPSGSEDRVPDFGRSSALSSKTSHTKLLLTDAMHKLNAGDGDRRIAKLLESLHRSYTLLDAAMVLLNQVIEISRRSQLGRRRQ